MNPNPTPNPNNERRGAPTIVVCRGVLGRNQHLRRVHEVAQVPVHGGLRPG